MKLPDHGRFAYSPITARPDFHWPEGKRLAVYLALNLEHFAFGEGLGGKLAPSSPEPDVLNYSWREYGNRVGAWRLLALFEELELPVSLLINSALYDHCPEVVAAYRDRGDEIVAHGRSNAEKQGEFDAAGERALIAQCTDRLSEEEGRAPAGWLGPWISQSVRTPELLTEAGYRYLLDWSHDDQPNWMQTHAGRILSVPYPQELNDVPAIMVRQAGAAEFADMIIDQFDEMQAQSRGQPLVMGIALHAYLVGQPYRLRHLRRALARIADQRDAVWITTSGAIAEHYAALHSG